MITLNTPWKEVKEDVYNEFMQGEVFTSNDTDTLKMEDYLGEGNVTIIKDKVQAESCTRLGMTVFGTRVVNNKQIKTRQGMKFYLNMDFIEENE